MKYVPFSGTRHARTFETTDGAHRYDDHHARRARTLGIRFARWLAQRGFERGRILDAGSAGGHTAVALAEAFPGATVVGIDTCHPLLARADALAKQHAVADRVSFLNRSVTATELETAAFQAVVSNDTLHVVNDPVAMLSECERVLEPGGILLVKNIRRSWLGWLDAVFRTAYTPAEVRDLIQKSRLRPCRVTADVFTLLIEASPDTANHAPA